MSKIQVASFEGKTTIMGVAVEVSFDDGASQSNNDYVEPATLSIRGLSLDQAMAMVALGVGESLAPASRPASEQGVPAHHASRAEDERGRREAALAKVRGDAASAAEAPASAPAPAPAPATKAPTPTAKAPAKEPEPPPPAPLVEAEDADDLDGDDGQGEGDLPDIDVDYLATQDKLRPVLEHLIASLPAGDRTPTKVVELARRYKDRVPALQAIEAKGPFDKRVDRAAAVVLGTGE